MIGPRISAIVPVFNGARFLGEAIDSVLAQTYEPVEIVVVDDGSTDGTARIARSYGDRILYVSQKNAGLGAARNAGIRHTTSPFVAFLDADDRWRPEKLARQMARFREQSDLDLCVTGFQNFWTPEQEVEALRFRDHMIARPFWGYVVPTMAARRDAFDRFGTFDPALRHSPGAVWIMRAVARGAKLAVIPDVLMDRRLHGSNLSKTAVEGSLEGFMHFIKARLDLSRRTSASRGATDAPAE
jgi:glycosyltransferase involved in cell wall biosynthesis